MKRKGDISALLAFSVAFALAPGILFSSCAGQGQGNQGGNGCASRPVLPAPSSCAGQDSCAALTGTAWVPNVAGLSAGNHGAGTLAKSVVTVPGVPILGLSQADPGNQHEVTVTVDMTSDLGAFGSLSLEARVNNYPSSLSGNAFPALVYLSDGVNDYINLARSGVNGDCVAGGYYTCVNGSCFPNPNCSVQWPSAYMDRDQWEQHQITNEDTSLTCEPYPSVNVFPTCNWTQGVSPAVPSNPACAFNTTFFSGIPGDSADPPRLRSGTTYTAKYVLLASDYSSLQGYTADLEVDIVKKQDTTGSVGGRALDLNVILVGTQNVQDSRAAAGKTNLDTLFTSVYDYLDQSGVGVKLGAIHPVEWACDKCGDAYASTDLSQLDELFSAGAGLLQPNSYPVSPPDSSGAPYPAINVYLLTSIPESSAGNNLTVLGLSGGISGPLFSGEPTNGVAVSTFNYLTQYNAACAADPTHPDPCPLDEQDAQFWDLGVTIAHELGHYLGLNHPSESQGTVHDEVYDTPICTTTEPVGGANYITSASCSSSADTNVYPPTGQTCSQACPGYADGIYCPTAMECNFNHIMWWTSKSFTPGSSPAGDGTIFSTDSGQIINYNPFVL